MRTTSIQRQIIAMLSGLGLLFVIMIWAVQVVVIQPSFEQIETREAMKDLHRCKDAIGSDLESLPIWPATGEHGTTRITLWQAKTISSRRLT